MIKKVLLSLTVIGLLSSSVYADVNKGQKLYLKKLKSKCGFNGTKFAGSFSSSEWEEIRENKDLDKLIKICPKAESIIKSDTFKEKYLEHILDFGEEFSSDSGNVPSC